MTSTVAQNTEQLSYRGGVCQARGQGKELIGDGVATRQLLIDESGSLSQFDAATGVVYTLPTITAATIGMEYEFAVTVAVTSNAHKIITADANTFLLGALLMYSIATASPAGFAANGTTIRSVSANGTTTGGLVGERYKVTAISLTQWLITGVQVGSGALATAFATS